ncbi:MAG: hypothetical protein VST69_06040 [Nitrospirota bacterium]|nr:hypothetical protein [Nitrospirota bacterium]
MLPEFIYRGDSDPETKRKLKTQYPGSAYCGLLTNLSNRGSGREIFSEPLVSTVNRHVDEGWSKTHYLSFSESEVRAKVFAEGKSGKKLKLVDKGHWDAALIRLDTQKFSKIKELEVGVFCCSYPGNSVEGGDNLTLEERIMRQQSNVHCAGQPSSILLINVISFLSAQFKATGENFSKALKNARKDSEWLVLPLGPATDIPGELTSKLDDGCLNYSFDRFQLFS